VTVRQTGLYLLSLTIGATLWTGLWIAAPVTGAQPAPLRTVHHTARRHAYGDIHR
jgi:hypothetical protein